MPETIEYLKGKPAYASYMNQMDLSSCIIDVMWKRCCISLYMMMTIQESSGLRNGTEAFPENLLEAL